MMPRIAMFLLCVLLSLPASAVPFEPCQVKAVYMMRFANFMTWPNEADLAEITYCSLGTNQVTETLATLLEEQFIRGKKVVYRELFSAGQVAGCQMVYVAPDRAPDLLPGHVGIGTVLVSDRRRYASRDGMMELRERAGRIVPVVNLDRMKKAQVVVRSQLLAISTVISEPEGVER